MHATQQHLHPHELCWDERFCGGAWVIRSYAGVSSALRDPRFSVRRAARWINGASPVDQADPKMREFKRIFARALLFLDGRAHHRLRGVLQPGFKPADLQVQATAISEIAHALIAAVLARAHTGPEGHRSVQFDFMADLARPLPALVIARLLGLTLDQPEVFVADAAALAEFIGSQTPSTAQAWRAQAALANMVGFFETAMAQPGAEHHDGLLGRIMRAQAAQRVSRIEALAQCCTLLLAGYETTRNLLGNGVLALLRHPVQWASLKADPSQLRMAIREMLRHDSPVQYTGRRLVDDVVMDGQWLRRGELAILHLGAANRDPRRFSNPLQFDIARDQGQHLAFGHGPHVCLGAVLSTMEAELALSALMQAMPDLSLVPDGLAWQHNPAYRALDQLQLLCHLPT